MQSEILQSVDKLSRDLAAASVTLSNDEARYLVDTYYEMQKNRIRAANQMRALLEVREPHLILAWLANQSATLENQIKRALEKYAKSIVVGNWALAQKGIGPIITAGLLAHIDIERAPTVGHIWRFAGLDPTQSWEKGKKRPWNASLKTLCWKIGESFVKVSNKDDAFYGELYKVRKELETKRNERNEFSEQATKKLQTTKIGKDTDAYKYYSRGQLPPAHIHARAKRYAVKMFLSHFHDVWYRDFFKTAPPKPFAIDHLGHAHYLPPPQG